MTYKEPTVGVAKVCNYPDMVGYRAECDCLDPDHAVYAYVEKDPDMEAVSLTIYVTAETPLSNLWGRIKYAVKILFTGRINYEASAIMQKEAATNYANAILNAIKKMS